jgi:hypothetical protein
MENLQGIPPLHIPGLLASDGSLKIFQVPPLLAAPDSGLQAMATSRRPREKSKDWPCA